MIEFVRSLLIPIALAQDNLNPDTTECNSIFNTGGYGSAAGTGFTCITQYIIHLTLVVIGLAGSICLIMLMINGFRYMIMPAIPGGSSDAAKKGIGAALTGFVLALLTYVILDTLINLVTQ